MPELRQSEGERASYSFCLESAQEQENATIDWLHHWSLPNGTIWLSYAKPPSGYYLRFPDLADFAISAGLSEIRCYPTADTTPETVRHLLLDQVLPRCLAQQGKIVLHASAVKDQHGALLFVGVSGLGKSTLASSFHCEGMPILSDDCVLLTERAQQPWAIPSYGGARLWHDSFSTLFDQSYSWLPVAHYLPSKGRLRFADEIDLASAEQGVPIRALYILVPPETILQDTEVNITPIAGSAAFIEVIKQTYQLDLVDKVAVARHVRLLAEMMKRLPIFRLHYRRRYDLLPSVRRSILAHAASL